MLRSVKLINVHNNVCYDSCNLRDVFVKQRRETRVFAQVLRVMTLTFDLEKNVSRSLRADANV